MAECPSSAKTIQIQPEPTSEVHCRIVASCLVSNCTIIICTFLLLVCFCHWTSRHTAIASSYSGRTFVSCRGAKGTWERVLQRRRLETSRQEVPRGVAVHKSRAWPTGWHQCPRWCWRQQSHASHQRRDWESRYSLHQGVQQLSRRVNNLLCSEFYSTDFNCMW